MADALLAWDAAAGAADLRIVTGDLAPDDGLQTAVVISLFSDARVEADLPPGQVDPRGWWGDAGTDDGTGSKLWLARPSKAQGALPARVEAWALEALQWLLDDAAATAVEALAEWGARNRLDLLVTVTLPAGDRREYTFNDLLTAA